VDAALLPSLNATLNAVSLALLVAGRRLARQKRVREHRRVMLSAFAVSSVFLMSYVTHKIVFGFESTTFNVTGAWKLAYLVFLVSHVLLAMLVPVLAIALITLGLRGRVESHRSLARLAWPIWVYVSVTGVMIYVLLYHLNPSSA
jgi:uncharacterized membrane protein YozB (DUF420 family)